MHAVFKWFEAEQAHVGITESKIRFRAYFVPDILLSSTPHIPNRSAADEPFPSASGALPYHQLTLLPLGPHNDPWPLVGVTVTLTCLSWAEANIASRWCLIQGFGERMAYRGESARGRVIQGTNLKFLARYKKIGWTLCESVG